MLQCCSVIYNKIANSAGVPQGSVLCPLLLNLYINVMSNVPVHSKIHMFANDICTRVLF